MRFLLLVVALAILSGCEVFAPGQAEYVAALERLEAGGPTLDMTDLAPDDRAAVYRHLDAAASAGHHGASQLRAVLVWQTDGLLASEPYWRAHAERDEAAWGMVAYIASARLGAEAGLHARDIPAGRQLEWRDVPAEVAVLREGVAAGSATADSLLRARLDGLRHQQAAGNADADSLLALLELPDA